MLAAPLTREGSGAHALTEDLEAFLGDPRRASGPLTFGQAVADDREERLPRVSLEALHAWGYTAYQVPAALGGRLESLEDLLALGRVVAARDPTVAVIANCPLAAAMPVWLAGTPEQRRQVAGAVLAGEQVALGLTEKDHGADLLASETTARRTEAGYVVDGTKWLINNVRQARYLCLLAREPERRGLRSLTLLLVDLQRLPSTSRELLPRIPTHGLCGADIAGIRFRDALVPVSACIGRPGRGLELTARSLLVTRSLVPGLSVGALDTALRCTVAFLRRRRLYGGMAVDIPYVQDELAAALLDLRIAGVVARCCVRILHLLPDLAPVSSAVAKYLVPHLAAARMRALATVLGARHFLRQDHWFGIFEKLLRDVRLFGLFDGSEPVVLATLAAQASCLSAPGVDPARADAVFDRRADVRTRAQPFWSEAFPAVAEEDPVVAGVDAACDALAAHCTGEDALLPAAERLRAAGREVLALAERPVDPRTETAQRLGDRYARLFAACCLARDGLGRSPEVSPGVPSPWLAAGLNALLDPGTRMPRAVSRGLYTELMNRCLPGGGDEPAPAPDKEVSDAGDRHPSTVHDSFA